MRGDAPGQASIAIRRARAVVWALWSLSILFVGIAFLFILASISADVPSRGFGFRGWVPIVAALWSTIGARIAARHPKLSVGWLIFAVGWLWSVNALFEEYSTFAYFPQELGLPLVPQAVWFDNMVGAAVAGLAALALLVVPTGRLLSRRWLPLALAVVVVSIASVAAYAFIPRRLVPFPFANPFAIEGLSRYEALFPTVFRSLDVARGLEVLLPTGALLLRLRSSTGAQRRQLKWVAFAASFTSLMVFVYVFDGDPIVQFAQIFGLVLIPLAFGEAMRRYRLYEIDRILDRTLVLGGATALLAGVYLASVGLVQRVFIALSGERSDVAVILTTLLVAAAFTPLRDRIQTLVKRAFGTEVSGTRGLGVFTAEIEEHLLLSDRDRLLSQLLAESVASLDAVAGALEISEGHAGHAVRALGAWTGDTQLIVDVRERGEVVARVLLGPRANGQTYDASARERLERAARAVGMALDRIDRQLPYSLQPKRTPTAPRG